MTPNDASSEARKNLRLIAGELRVSLRGISDEDLNIVAIRFVLDGQVTADALQRIVDDVREGGRGGGSNAEASTQSRPTPLPAPSTGYRFNATEADRRQRHKLAMQHLSESSRTGLFVVPKRPKRLGANVPHPACLAAAREGRDESVCELRCRWLLNKGDPYVEAWLDRDDSTGGRL